ncbi:extracellular solute-binding protein [Bengtsoniella intestinalis]|uniref:extracellular solute-binding protein n=1 Tax=Bengtsoniella intestinalis TaxID=3073143 RepID=UPI00391EF3B6
MTLKKLSALFLSATMILSLAACGSSSSTTTTTTESTTTTTTTETAGDDVELTLWTYPIGSWGDQATTDAMIANFEAANPGITVTVQFLDYTSGDDQVTSAIQGGTTPDLIMEGPERLVSNWGAAGKMVALNDLWTDDVIADISAISDSIPGICLGADGNYYEYPLAMTVHTMGINYELFEATGALDYIDLETRTWTTEGFVAALELLAASDAIITPAVVYCGGQGGDQGTRALVNNLYSGQFTDAAVTTYTSDSAENMEALQLLVDLVDQGLLSADAGIAAAEELQMFANETVAMSFCWNAANQATYASQVAFTPYAVAFPSDDGVPMLEGGVWGFGIFDNGDDAKIEAAKTFIKFMTEDEVQGVESVAATGFFPVRASQGDIYTGTEKEESNAPYVQLMPYMGSYYAVAPDWASARTAWWNMLQQVFSGTSVEDAVATYSAEVN